MPERKATPEDARLILQLYNLRREPEMRKARRWVEAEFWPRNAEEVFKLCRDFGSQENTYLRMVGGYWEMAASLVVCGALDAMLFHDNNHEMYFFHAKLDPFVTELRQTLQAPEFAQNIEQVVNSTPGGRERLERMTAGIARWLAERDKKQAAGESNAG